MTGITGMARDNWDDWMNQMTMIGITGTTRDDWDDRDY